MTRLETYEERSRTPMTLLAFVFLFVYALPILYPGMSSGTKDALFDAQNVVWVLFIADFAWRLYLAPARWAYLRSHPIDILVVALPALRPLRLVSALLLINEQARERFRGSVAIFIPVSLVTVVIISSLAVLQAERGHPGATITSLPDALWWSAVTITTVGYGDVYPITDAGRLYAVALMMTGIGLLGMITAALASWMIERLEDEDKRDEEITMSHVEEVLAEVRALRAEVASLRSAGPSKG